ncbi:MAG: hypothetical protein FJX11_08420 [Alphaproteobacteria bacterium]|nr:hypothetical protein [Alphaproteobacteria bacterium]
MLKISLTTTGLLDKRELAAWTRSRREAIHKAVALGMRDSSRSLTDALRTRMQSDLAIRKPAFLRSMRAKVLDRDPLRLPALLVGSRVSWLGVHVRGATLTGKMLIPLTESGRRMWRKAFARVIDTLMRSGNAWFIRKDGKVILMAENIKENASALTRFKRAERHRTGAKSIKRGQEIPIAVLVPRVTLKRRFDFDGTVRRAMPQLAQSINRYLNRN